MRRREPARSTSQTVNDTRQVADRLRATVRGKELVKRIYLQGADGISPTIIKDILKQAGVNVPPGIETTVDVAQVIISGGAVVEGIHNADSIQSIATPTAQGLRAIQNILIQNGLAEKEDPSMQITRIGTSVALIVASGGLNVLAWLSFASDVLGNWATFNGLAKRRADAEVQAQINARRVPQMQSFARNFEDYSNGRISMWQFMGQIAESSPDFFPSYFPQIGQFVPSVVRRYCSTQRTWSIFRGSEEHTTCREVQEVMSLNRDEFRQLILKTVIMPACVPYFWWAQNRDAEDNVSLPFTDKWLNHKNPVRRISPQSMALLSFLPPYFNPIVSADVPFEWSALLQTMNLTPHDLGDDVLKFEFDKKNSDFFLQSSIDPKNVRTGIVLDGRKVFSGRQQEEIKKSFVTGQLKDLILETDRMGYITKLNSFENIRTILNEWGRINVSESVVKQFQSGTFVGLDAEVKDFWTLNPATNQIDWTESARQRAFCVERGSEKYCASQQQFRQDISKNWLDMQNFIGALSLIDQLRRDQWFTDKTNVLKQFDFFGTVDAFKQKHQELTTKMTLRKMNTRAVLEVAKTLEVQPSRLVMRTPRQEGKPTVFSVKGS